MGLFSKKKKIYVSSVVYNLAGGPKDRVRYLPTTVNMKIISNSQASISEAVQSSLINGPGIRMRSFGRWARTTGYTNLVGQRGGVLHMGDNIDFDSIISQLPNPSGLKIAIQSAEIGDADYGYWADRWMLDNHPAEVDGDYELDYDTPTNTVTISFLDRPVVYKFQPANFDIQSQYLYVSYTYNSMDVEDPVIPGTLIYVDSADDWPSVSGWTFRETVNTPKSQVVNETVHTLVTYSDGRPDEESTVTTPSTVDYSEVDSIYRKTDFIGLIPDGSGTSSLRQIMHRIVTKTVTSNQVEDETEETLEDGTIKKTTVTTITESMQDRFAYRIDKQAILTAKWSRMYTFIYRKGDGNAVLEPMFAPSQSDGAYFPFIPMRLNKSFLSESNRPDIYAQNIKAVKKAMNTKYSKILNSIKENDSIGDVDYAYISFGVALNTKENASKKYIYKFFQGLMQNAGGSAGEYNAWRVAWNAADLTQKNWVTWKNAQSNPLNPLFGKPEPARQPYPASPVRNVVIQSPLAYDMRISWDAIAESVGAGKAWAGAKSGDIRLELGSVTDYEELLISGGLVGTRPAQRSFVTITWQDSDTTWRTIGVWNLYHDNVIYKGKAVNTSAADALSDPEESGFIIPLHEGVFKSMSLKDSTQMSMSNAYIVFNCYKVVKQKWYQTSWFKVVLVIIVIIITIVTWGSGGAAGAGLLGTAASVGAALGFVGVMAIVIGAIANALAAMLLSQIIMMGASKLFGDKVGAVIGTFAAIFAVSYGTSLANGGTMATAFTSLSSAQGLMRLTIAAGNGFAQYMNADSADIIAANEKLLENYKETSLEIAKLFDQNLGFGSAMIDPMMFVDVNDTKHTFVPEPPDTFLSRTLMCGSDIAEMTNSMLTNFVEMTTSTDLPS